VWHTTPEKKETVTLRHLAADLAESHALPKAIADPDGRCHCGTPQKRPAHPDEPLGTLQVRERAAFMGRNPATGEANKIKASEKVAFRAAN